MNLFNLRGKIYPKFLKPKLLFMMKVTLFLSFVLSFSLLATTTYSQNTRMSLDVKAVTVKSVLKLIEEQSNFRFFFNSDLADLDKVVDGSFRDKTIDEILRSILSGTSVGYRVLENNFVVLSSAEMLQQIAITGTVTDTDGEPLPGVNVVVKGTFLGAVTNADGAFSINVPDANATLVFSFVGYASREVTVGNQRSIDVQLQDDASLLDEVVVIGYGTMKKKDLTGAVGSLRAKDIGNVSVVNVEQMIQGRIAGVDVINNGGLPGQGTSIKIRGVGTIYNSDPLYVIDGMPGDINSVSQYDIESIEILKDASSTAIYGARAANGVVLITTKRGQKGRPKVTLNAYVGVAQVAKKLDMLNASEYIDLVTEINPGFFRDAIRFKPESEGGMGMTEQWARTDRVNIQDEIFRNALQQEYHLNVNGGGENSVYNISGTYTDMDGITVGYHYGRFNLMSNLEFTILKNIKIGQSLSIKRTNRNDVRTDFVGPLRWAPYMPLEEPNNSWGYSKLTTPIDANDTFNPMSDLLVPKNLDKSTSIREQFYVDVSFWNMFKWRTQLQYTNNSGNYMGWAPYRENGNLTQPASISENYSFSESAMVENYLNFNKEVGIHSFNAMIGNTYSSTKLNNGRNLSVSGSGSGDTAWENYEVLLVNRTPGFTITGNNTWYGAYLSYYGRVNYSLMDRYLFTFNYRQDASPNFSPRNRWGRFPSLAVAWKMEEENFMKQFRNLTQAKLRLSWGKSGNDRINSYAYLANLYSGSNNNIVAALGTDHSQFMGITINGLPAYNIRWETTTSYNAGVDLGLFRNIFTASIDVYTRLTDGILINVPIPHSSGIDSPPMSNAAEVRNTGIEFAAGYNNRFGEFNLSVSGVVSYNKNEVISLGNGEPIMNDMVRTEKGHSIGEYYGYKVDRLLQTKAEADAYTEKYCEWDDENGVYKRPASAGDIAFKDIDGPDGNGPDGKITDNDRVFIGRSIPPWTFGMNISANYRHFDFQLGMSGVAGNNLYDYTRIFELDAMKRPFNQTTEVLKRWKKEGDITDVPRAASADPADNLRNSDRYIKNGSYLRIKNVTLGYTVPIPTNNYIERLRLYVSCQNLFTFTKYNGFDPEFGSEYEYETDRYNMRRGVVRGTNITPIPRTFMFGVQATF